LTTRIDRPQRSTVREVEKRPACPALTSSALAAMVRLWPILLQKSKVAGPRIFRENPKRKAITDSYNLNRIAEVAGEFNVRR
jgi:hypothetical protein